MTRVYVVQEPLKRDAASGEVISRFPMDDCKAYGEVINVFSWSALRNLGMEPSGESIDALTRHARDVMCDYKEDDFIVPVGNPALIAIVSLIASEKTDGRVQVLDWMRQERAYRVMDVDLGCLDVIPTPREVTG